MTRDEFWDRVEDGDFREVHWTNGFKFGVYRGIVREHLSAWDDHLAMEDAIDAQTNQALTGLGSLVFYEFITAVV